MSIGFIRELLVLTSPTHTPHTHIHTRAHTNTIKNDNTCPSATMIAGIYKNVADLYYLAKT